MFVILDDKEYEYLEYLKKRLYSEIRMNADEMRDNANRLYILIDRLEKITEDNLRSF